MQSLWDARLIAKNLIEPKQRAHFPLLAAGSFKILIKWNPVPKRLVVFLPVRPELFFKIGRHPFKPFPPGALPLFFGCQNVGQIGGDPRHFLLGDIIGRPLIVGLDDIFRA